MSGTTAAATVLATGRIVWGDLFKGTPKLDDNDQPVIDPETGAQVIEYSFGLAIPKSEFTQDKMGPGGPAEIWAVMQRQAMLAYGNQQPPQKFSWKYKDGDGFDHNNKPFAEREGYAGHLVFALSTRIPFEVVKWDDATKKYYPVREGIKCGDYVQVQLNIKAHSGNPQKRNAVGGVYLNPLAALFVGYGKEIVNGPTAEMRFGNQAPTLPPGASATPLAPANSPLGGPVQGMPGMGQVTPGLNSAPSFPQSTPQGAMPGLPGQAAPTHGMPAGGTPNGFGNGAYPAQGGTQSAQQQPGMPAMPAPGAQQVDPNYQVLPPHLQPQTQQMPGASTVVQGFPQPGGFPMPGGR